MINYKYSEGWANQFAAKESAHNVTSTFSALQSLASQGPQTKQTVSEFTRTIIQFIINNFDADNTLLGLFRLIKFANKHRISPFLATHDYCVKVLSATQNGELTLNISPIYHLGPEYPEYYEQKQGKALTQEAIIGLIESESSNPEEPSTFNLGIDAGIAFQQAAISHNKHMTLQIKIIDDGLMCNLNCEGQATSKSFTWEALGMPSAAYTDLYSQKVQNIWAA